MLLLIFWALMAVAYLGPPYAYVEFMRYWTKPHDRFLFPLFHSRLGWWIAFIALTIFWCDLFTVLIARQMNS